MTWWSDHCDNSWQHKPLLCDYMLRISIILEDEMVILINGIA